MSQPDRKKVVAILLKDLRLTSMADNYQDMARRAEQQGWSFEDYLRELLELEINERRRRRVDKLLRDSKLPPDKTFANFDQSHLSTKVRRTVASLCEGHFLDRAENLLAFGLPGRGKTHLLCAIGHELVCRGRRVLFIPTFKLVQRLLVAKRELTLERELKRLDRYEAVLVDDLGYVQQSREEMEVLFTFLSERYERRSVWITSNLVFSQWERIFKDPMTTAAAIDRLIHHATILELAGKSLRDENAKRRQKLGHEESGNDANKKPPSGIDNDADGVSEARSGDGVDS